MNPEARTPKFEQEVMGKLVRFVAAHEVGHTLGLPHNMGSSPAYTVEQLRTPGFVQENGVAPSIMDYARFNYVAQPEDEGIGLDPKIGPYDYYAIRYGYLPIPDGNEEEVLNEMIRERADDPIYRYGRQTRNGHDASAPGPKTLVTTPYWPPPSASLTSSGSCPSSKTGRLKKTNTSMIWKSCTTT